MARFYGTVQGGRGEASRVGHVSLQVTAQSCSGDITVHLFVDANGEDCVEIWVAHHEGRYAGTFYDGPIKDLLTAEGRTKFLEMIGKQLLQAA